MSRRSATAYSSGAGIPSLTMTYLPVQATQLWSTRPGLADERPGAGGLDRSGQRLDVVGAVVTLLVDEERRCSGDSAEVGRLDVLVDSGRENVAQDIVAETLLFEPQ